MSLNRFINSQDILASNTLMVGRVIPDSVIKALSYNEGLLSNYSVSDSNIDIHLYDNSGEYIRSMYDQNMHYDSQYNDFYYNISKSFFRHNISSGFFKLCLNFSLDIFGTSTTRFLSLKEISSDNRELMFKVSNNLGPAAANFRERFVQFESVLSNLQTLGRVNNLVVNFGSNRVQSIVNIKTEYTDSQYYVYVKLLNALDSDIDLNDFCRISFKLCEDYIDSFLVSPLEIEVRPNKLRGPNFDLPYELEGGDSTSFKTWDTLLVANETTTNDILQSIVSSSNSIELNIDYTDFGNFVHYGSAQERLKNYDYKRRLLEYYESNLISSSVSSSFYGNINNIENKNKIENIKSTFDPFERWLHVDLGDTFTHDITGSVTPAPKYLDTDRYVLYSTSTSEYATWYSSSLSAAYYYDDNNLDRLYEYTPGHIVNDSNNSEYILFLEMIGHHFDNIYAYISELTSIHSKDEHPKRGIPNKLLKEYAESLGWDITDGYALSDLWLYKLGTDNSGSYSDVSDLPSVAHENLSHQIWRRVVNNLPLLLKTKGTSRSVKALMASYGIPKTLISIKEYGGPVAPNFTSYREDSVFSYALDFDGDQYVELPVYPTNSTGSSTYEFRFKTKYSSSLSMSLWSIEENSDRSNILHNLELVSFLAESTASYSSSYSYGKLRYTGTYESSSTYYTSSVETEYLPLFDNDFWNVQVKSNDYLSDSNTSSSITLSVLKSSDYTNNRISFSSSVDWIPSGSINYTFGATTNLTASNHYLVLGGSTGSAEYSRFSGSLQQYKEYSEIIDYSTLVDHTLNPPAYNSLDYSSSFDDLVRYFPFGGDVIRYNHTSSIYITSSHPNRDNISDHSYARFYNFSGGQSDQYSANNEVYYTKIPSTGGVLEKHNKVRIEDNETTGFTLSPDKRVEQSSFDRSSKDINRLVIAFSPTDQINRDIYNQFGNFSLDNILGDPRDQETSKYSLFDSFREEYWKKYENKNNLNKYIEVFSLFNFTFFDQLQQLTPARANLISGVLVENTILERPRIERKNPSIEYRELEQTILARTDNQTAELLLNTSSIEYERTTIGKYTLYTSSLDYDKVVDITNIEEEAILPIDKSLFIDQNEYSGSAYSLIDFYDYKDNSELKQVVTSNDYLGSYNISDSFIIAKPINICSHDSSGSLLSDTLNITEDVDLTGIYKVHASGSSLRKYNSISSFRVGAEYVEREYKYRVKQDGSYTDYTRSFLETNDYSFDLKLYEDTPYEYKNIENRIGYISNFDYESFYSGSLVGSFEITSSLMGIQTTVDDSLLYDFIKRYKYVVDSEGYFYTVKNNGRVQVCVTGSLTNPNYQSRIYFYTSSNSYNNNFKYNYVDVAVSQSNGLYHSSSLVDSTYQYYYDSVYDRVRFEGSRLEGPDINVNSINTIDGGPVVSIIEVNSTDLRV